MSKLTEAIRVGLAQKLKGSSSVANIAPGGIHHDQAPANATYPLVIFSQSSNRRDFQTFADRNGRNSLWLVKGVSVGEDAGPADDLSAAIETLLDDSTLTISGGALYRMSWESDVQYLEEEDGQQIRHSGSLFRIQYTTS